MRTTHLIGRTEEGGRLIVDISLSIKRGEGCQTVRHEPARETYPELSVMGHVIEKGQHSVGIGGQCWEDLLCVESFADGWTAEDRDLLYLLWRRYHLNGMRAGCAHMPVHDALITKEDGEVDYRRNRCPLGNGYFYGSAWLVEYLPIDVVQAVTDLQRKPVGDLPTWFIEEAAS